MSNLKLVPDDPTPLEKLLLDASRAERPSEDHKAQLRAALGLGVPLSGPFAAPVPGASSATLPQPAAASLPPPVAAATSSAAAVKVAAGVGMLAVVGALWFALGRDEAPAPGAAPIVAVSKPLAAVAPAPAAAPVEALPASPLPPLEEPTVAPRQRAAAPAAASVSEDLSEQIRLIEAARAGVAARDPKSALSALDSYSSKFPRGSFGQEATVLRIRAVDQAGDSARATAMAKSFVTRFPNSPHVARLKPIAERGASR